MSHRTVTANGLTFAYVEEGTGPLVLMVHGFPDTWHTWDAVRPQVAAAGFRVVTPNQRGYFPTGLAPDGRYDTDALGEDVLALIDALGERQAILVGHDWGAGAAYAAAALAPHQVTKLVAIGIPHPASVTPTPKLAWTVRHFLTLRLPGAVARTAANDFATIDRLVQRWSPAWKVPPDETRHVKEAFAHEGSLDAALGYYRALRPTLPKGSRLKISVPTVAFAGLDDTIAPSAYEPARSWFTHGYEVVTMRGGHFMHREHPGEFIPKLLAVLRSAPSPRAESESTGPRPT